MPPRSSFTFDGVGALQFSGGDFAHDNFSFRRSRVADNSSIAEKSRVVEYVRGSTKSSKPCPGSLVAGGYASLDHHLQFPVASAIGVILAGGFERNAHFALAAIGTQAQVHAIAHALAGIGGKQRGELIRGAHEEFAVGNASALRRRWFRHSREYKNIKSMSEL